MALNPEAEMTSLTMGLNMFESRSEDKEVRIRRETKQQTYRDVPAGFDCSCLWQGCTAYYEGPRHFPRVAAAQKILL